MAAKIGDYRSVLEVLKGRHDTAAYINKLSKVWASTEDAKLRAGLHAVIEDLKK